MNLIHPGYRVWLKAYDGQTELRWYAVRCAIKTKQRRLAVKTYNTAKCVQIACIIARSGEHLSV